MADGGTDQPVRIFINYRRDDTRAEAGRLYDWLQERFGKDNVFKDIDTIRPGMDFRRSIDEALTSADVVLALIGKQWIKARDTQRRPRIHNPNDFVRLELQGALERPDVLVIPVLVEGAEMPHADEFPEPLRELAFRHAIDLSDGRWRTDVERLIVEIERVAAEAKGATPRVLQVATREPARAPVQAPIPAPIPASVPPARRSNTPIVAGGIGLAAVAVVAAVIWLGGDREGIADTTPSPSPSASPTASPTASPSPTISPSEAPSGSASASVPAPVLTADEQALLAHIPASIRDTCQSSVALTPVLAALNCGPPEIFGVYRQYPDPASMTEAYESAVGSFVTIGMGGHCETDVTAEGTYDVADVVSGRIACYIGNDGDSWIYWTHDPTNILAYASRFDDDSPALYTYWQGAVPE